MENKNKSIWSEILKIAITVLTALATFLEFKLVVRLWEMQFYTVRNIRTIDELT